MANDELIKAYRKGKTAVFSQGAWASGTPQRYGWIAEFDAVPKKSIPAEILEFAEIRKKAAPVKPMQDDANELPAKTDPPQQDAAVKAKPKPTRKPSAKRKGTSK